ncbi:hypothetical protein [Streptomyces cinereoruber]|uniref:hypothetical protein n=1 Tax=Streptomyces cinereoruber TaxID=67260 RepID=UPI003651892F
MNEQLERLLEANTAILCGALFAFRQEEVAKHYQMLLKDDLAHEYVCLHALKFLCLEAKTMTPNPTDWEDNALLPVALAAHRDLLDRLGHIAYQCPTPGEVLDNSIIDLAKAMPDIVRQSVEPWLANESEYYQSDHRSDYSHPEQGSFELAASAPAYPIPTQEQPVKAAPPDGEMQGVHQRAAKAQRYPDHQESDGSRPGQAQLPDQGVDESTPKGQTENSHPIISKRKLQMREDHFARWASMAGKITRRNGQILKNSRIGETIPLALVARKGRDGTMNPENSILLLGDEYVSVAEEKFGGSDSSEGQFELGLGAAVKTRKGKWIGGDAGEVRIRIGSKFHYIVHYWLSDITAKEITFL